MSYAARHPIFGRYCLTQRDLDDLSKIEFDGGYEFGVAEYKQKFYKIAGRLGKLTQQYRALALRYERAVALYGAKLSHATKREIDTTAKIDSARLAQIIKDWK